jgi:transcriptional regulator with XRE-family HTH domain|tara:strand:- start:468 stop:716 length:249 start_codon:yes stop_codon:yes gene_type:complete
MARGGVYAVDYDFKAFGEHVRSTRKGLGMSQAEVGRMVRRTGGWVMHVEQGRAQILCVDAALLIIALGVDLSVGLPPDFRPE